MKKRYDISKKSDIRRFERDLKSEINSAVKREASKMSHYIQCPKCKQTLSATAGSNVCPHCGNEIELRLTFDL